jgi:hypothetical protein
MKKILLTAFVFFNILHVLTAQQTDSTKIKNKQLSSTAPKDTTQNDDQDGSEDAETPAEKEVLPVWFYSFGVDGSTNSGNVNRHLVNVKATLNFEKPTSIFGFFSSPRFQYGTNSDILQEREFFVDFNSTLFYAQKDVYGILFGNFEQSNLRKIASRYSVGVGIGWKIIGGRKNPKSLVKLSISNAFVKEITDYLIKDDKNIFRNSTRIRLKYDIIPEKFFFQSVLFLQPSLIDNNYRWNSSTQISYKVGKHIAILASFENTYENFNVTGVLNSQTSATLGLTYSGSN